MSHHFSSEVDRCTRRVGCSEPLEEVCKPRHWPGIPLPDPPPQLFVDRTSPDSLAPWLLMLEKRAPFVVHEIDPKQKDNFAIPTNPSGVRPRVPPPPPM